MNFDNTGIKKNRKKKVIGYLSNNNDWHHIIHEIRVNNFLDGFSSNYNCKVNKYYTEYEETDYIVIHGWIKDNQPGEYREYLIESHDDLDTIIVLENSWLYHNTVERVSRDATIRNKIPNTSVGFGGLGGCANYNNSNSLSDRFDALGIEFKKSNWRINDKILIMSQLPGDAHLYKVDFQTWVSNTYKELRLHTDRPIYFRPHPEGMDDASKIPAGCKLSDSNIKIYDELETCYAVVTYNSNSVMECVLSGVPVFAFDKQSVAYDLSYQDLSQIENLTDYDEQDRLQWAYNLAYSQWTDDELKQGLPHKHLGLI